MKERAPNNRTLTLTTEERRALASRFLTVESPVSAEDICGRVIMGDIAKVVDMLPDSFVDLMIVDPPYNLSKNFNGVKFARMDNGAYLEYLASWFPRLLRLLKPTATVYMCGDWQCSGAEYQILSQYLTVRNRIVWQREKGRGAAANWKNCTEDIWFATKGNEYCFNLDAVKQKRRVIAPYRNEAGIPKDWKEEPAGKFRLTCPSNFWTDISVPFWSMPENTDHPTQKPEKLLAKLILASSNPGDVVFDPFLGSGTTAVVAKKLGRQFCGVEINEEYCCWALERLRRADDDPAIQGYEDGVFYDRNC